MSLLTRSRTPARLLAAAAILVALWAALELVGGRAATVALAGAVREPAALVFALAYLASWFAALLLAPPLALTAAVLALHDLARRRLRAASPARSAGLP